LSEGSVERALQFTDPALREFREQMISALSSTKLDRVRFGRAVQSFVDEAGTEAVVRRSRLRTVIGLGVELYRHELRHTTADPTCANGWAGSAEPIVRALDCSLAALEHVDRNANQALVIQAWCAELTPLHGTAIPA
jgi:hypothetical protein